MENTAIATYGESRVHYDLPVELYQGFLDPYLKYSSGLYTTGEETLETAIVAMLDRHVDLIAAHPHPRILEIGPGWGSFLKRLKQRGVAFEYTAVNSSPMQNHHIRTAIWDEARLITQPFEAAVLPPSSFDAIYLIGSFCHLRDKETQVAKLRSLLAPGGIIVIEDTYFLSDEVFAKHMARAETRFVQQQVFGFAEIVGLPAFLELAVRQNLSLASLLEHSDSYRRTIVEWQKRLAARDHREAPQAKVFSDYMDIFQRGWNYTIANYLMVLKHRRLPGASR